LPLSLSRWGPLEWKREVKREEGAAFRTSCGSRKHMRATPFRRVLDESQPRSWLRSAWKRRCNSPHLAPGSLARSLRRCAILINLPRTILAFPLAIAASILLHLDPLPRRFCAHLVGRCLCNSPHLSDNFNPARSPFRIPSAPALFTPIVCFGSMSTKRWSKSFVGQIRSSALEGRTERGLEGQ